MKIFNFNEKQMKAIEKVAAYADIEKQFIESEVENDFITINTGRNGREYAWYSYENEDVLCDVETLEIIHNDAKFIEEQFC